MIFNLNFKPNNKIRFININFNVDLLKIYKNVWNRMCL